MAPLIFGSSFSLTYLPGRLLSSAACNWGHWLLQCFSVSYFIILHRLVWNRREVWTEQIYRTDCMSGFLWSQTIQNSPFNLTYKLDLANKCEKEDNTVINTHTFKHPSYLSHYSNSNSTDLLDGCITASSIPRRSHQGVQAPIPHP